MTINNISFGQITKINSSIQAAKQIVDIANNESKKSVFSNFMNRKIKTQIISAFPDLSEGKAVIYTDKKNITYIFTGKDALIYEEIFNKHTQDAERAEYYYSAFPTAGLMRKIEEEKYHLQVSDLISSSAVKEANISLDNEKNKPVTLEMIG